MFDVTGGLSINLPDQVGVLEIPSFIGTVGSAVITVTPRANGCIGVPITFTYTIAPVPTIDAIANVTQCAG